MFFAVGRGFFISWSIVSFFITFFLCNVDRNFVSCFGVLVKFSDSFVFDVSTVPVVISDVGNDLSAAVGQQDAVRTSDVTLVVAGLFMGVIVVRWLILDSIRKVIRSRSLNEIMLTTIFKFKYEIILFT